MYTSSLVANLILVLILLLLYSYFRNLYLSPLKYVPGPTLAALSRLYEFYYNGVRPYVYGRRIEQLHYFYGDIVRINPNEVHIRDAHFHAIFRQHDKDIRKDEWMYNLGLPGATGLMVEEDKHRKHRTALASAMTPKFANEIPSIIQQTTDDLFQALLQSNGKSTVNASDAFRSLARDIMMSVFLGENEDLVNTSDLGHLVHKQCRALFQLAAWQRQFSCLNLLVEYIPDYIARHVAAYIPLQRYICQTTNILKDRRGDRTTSGLVKALVTAHHDIHHVDIADEAVEGIIGGTEAIGHALTSIMFHLAQRKDIQSKLRRELKTHSFHSEIGPSAVLNGFPYLTAVVKEGLRTQRGNYYRFARKSCADIKYRQFVIPAGTTISMCPKDTHEDASFFPDPFAFKPERWLESNAQELERYLLTFGWGAYKCLGIRLAKLALHYAVARFVHDYDFNLAAGEDAILRDGCLEIFPQRASEGLKLNIVPSV